MSTRSTQRTIGLACATAAGIALALQNILIPFAYAAGSEPLTVVFLRFVFLVCGLAAAIALLGRPLLTSGRDIGISFLSGFCVAAGSFGLLASFAYIPVSLAVLVLYTFPILTTVLSSLAERRLPGPVQTTCLFVALGGLAFALDIFSMPFDIRGIAFAQLAAAGFAVAFVVNARFLGEMDSDLTTLYMALAGSIATGAILAMSGTFSLPDSSAGLVSTGWQALLGICILFLIAFVTMFRSVKLIGSTPTAMLMNLEPVFTFIFAAILLGERLTPRVLIGGSIVLAAVIASQLRSKARAETQEAHLPTA